MLTVAVAVVVVVVMQIVGLISVFFICISILSFCLKTHPDMRVPVIRNVTVQTSHNSTAWTLDKTQTNAHDAFFYIECVCNAWFTIEILSRFVASPNKILFAKVGPPPPSSIPLSAALHCSPLLIVGALGNDRR